MKTVLRVLWLPAAVFAMVLGWLWLDAKRGWVGVQLPLLGGWLVIVGGALAIWCVWLFFSIGKGSPHPFAMKTKHLVTSGPFALVRNPMMWGIGALLVGLAFLLGSLGLWFGFIFFVLFARWFVSNYEERDMERRFGEEYRDYCNRVPRWWPGHPKITAQSEQFQSRGLRQRVDAIPKRHE